MAIDRDALHLVLRRLILDGENHRRALFQEINRRFLDYVFDYVEAVAAAKADAGSGWYAEFLQDPRIATADRAVRGGLPVKTITNIQGKTSPDVVLEETTANIADLNRLIATIQAERGQPSHVATLTVGELEVQLSLEESLIVLNSLAVKRAQISGGLWSSIGKRVEEPLMMVLCRMFNVPDANWAKVPPKVYAHEIDFVLQSPGRRCLCEVKMVGRGNPESAKAAPAHDAGLLVADWLSDQQRGVLNGEGIAWVSLADKDGWQRFGKVLDEYDIPHTEGGRPIAELDEVISEVLEEIA